MFTGISGSGKSSLAFGTLFAEAQRRYLESVAPYARRLFDQMGVPEVDSIDGLPPAVALQQQRGSPTTRSSVGSVSTLSNLLRMLYSRAGTYPPRQPHLEAESFSTNTPEGACPQCHGLGRVYDVTERSMVPDDSLTIRQRAIAAWPTAWQGQNLRDILVSLGYNVDRPWRELPKKDRDWILYTEEQPTVPVYAGYTPEETRRALKRKEEPSYQGTFTGARLLRPAHFRKYAERVNQKARVAISGQHRMSAVPRQAAAAASRFRSSSRLGYRGHVRAVPDPDGGHSAAPGGRKIRHAEKVASGTSRKGHRRAAHRPRILLGESR